MLTIAGGIVLAHLVIAALSEPGVLEELWAGAQAVAVIAGVLALIAFVSLT